MILKETSNGIGQIILNRPEKKNALNRSLIDAFIKALEEESRNDSRYLLIKGAGNTYCSGADLNENFNELLPHLKTLYEQLASFPKPIISYVEGYCLAGGMGLIALSDLVYAHPHAKFGLPEIKKGIVPAKVYTLLKPILNPRHLNELAYTGEFISATRAYEIGLINHIGELPTLPPSDVLLKIRAMR